MPEPVVPLPSDRHTWIAIDDPDAVCAAYEHLWEQSLPPPFAGSGASLAVEAMAWDPWSHFDGATWASPWFEEGDRVVQVGARAFVQDDAGSVSQIGRREASGVRVTDRLGRAAPGPRAFRTGRLVLECALTVCDRGGVSPTRRTRIPAGSVITVEPG